MNTGYFGAVIGSASFCLLLSALPAQSQTVTHQLGVLGTGDKQLDTGNFFDSYALEGVEGQRISISLDSSDFDTSLGLFDSEGNPIATNNNAANDNSNSYLSTTLPHSGSYTVVATSHLPQAGGDYRMALRSFAPPATVGRTASSGTSSSGWDSLAALVSIPFVQDMIWDAMFSSGGTAPSTTSSYDYYNQPSSTSQPAYGHSAPPVGGFYGNGPQHGTRNAW